MKITVTYEVSMPGILKRHQKLMADALIQILRGPLRTGIDATNAQLEAEGRRTRFDEILKIEGGNDAAE